MSAHPKALLTNLGAAARKSLSQNFLISPHWVEKLTEPVMSLSDIDEIWEIGPGLGALTAQLKTGPKPVRAFEYDRKLSGYLRETHPTVDIREGDVLRADFKSIAPEARRIGLVSNLPYHLSSPVLFKIIEEGEGRFVRLVLTFQKEFAARLIAKAGTSDYGGLSVLIQASFSMSNIGTIPPGAFYPAPGVSSTALVFEPRAPEVPLKNLSRVTKTAFSHPRKKLSSNLKEQFPTAEARLNELGVSPNARPEELTLEQYVALTRNLV